MPESTPACCGCSANDADVDSARHTRVRAHAGVGTSGADATAEAGVLLRCSSRAHLDGATPFAAIRVAVGSTEEITRLAVAGLSSCMPASSSACCSMMLHRREHPGTTPVSSLAPHGLRSGDGRACGGVVCGEDDSLNGACRGRVTARCSVAASAAAHPRPSGCCPSARYATACLRQLPGALGGSRRRGEATAGARR